MLLWHHEMIHGIGKTGIHTLHALGAVSAVEAAGSLIPACLFLKAKLHFLKIALSLIRRQFLYCGTFCLWDIVGERGIIWGIRSIRSIRRIMNYCVPLSAQGHIIAL